MARLTIPDEQTFAEFTVVTSTSVFPITFSLFAKADLTVLIDGEDLGQSGFSFSGTVLDGGGYDGGTVTLNLAVAGVTVRIERNVAAERTSNFAPAGTTPVQSVDQALNRVTAILQDLERKKLTTPTFERAGKYLAFDADGLPYAASGSGADSALRTDLADTDGASLVGQTQSGTGAYARSLKERATEQVSVLDFIPTSLRAAIIAGTSTTNVAPYIQAALDAHLKVHFPDGFYKITAQLTPRANQTIILTSGVTIQQYTADTPIFYALSKDNLTFLCNGALLKGEGTWSAGWTGGAGHNDRAFSLTDCDNFVIDHPHTRNCGLAGIVVDGGVGGRILWPRIEGTNLYSTALPSGANHQMGIYLIASATYGAPDRLVVVGADISGVAQGVLAELPSTGAQPTTPPLFIAPNFHDITGQHGLYCQFAMHIVGPTFTNIELNAIKLQTTSDNNQDIHGFSATGVVGRNIGSSLFEAAQPSGTGSLTGVEFQGVGVDVAIGLSLSGRASGRADMNIDGCDSFLAAAGAGSDFSVTVKGDGCDNDGFIITSTTSTFRIRPDVKNVRRTAGDANSACFNIASASAVVDIYEPKISAASGSHMKYAITNKVAGGIVTTHGQPNITGHATALLLETDVISYSGWRDFPLAVTASSGTFTTVTNNKARFKVENNTVSFDVNFTLTTVGTASGEMYVDLPVDALYSETFMGVETQSLGDNVTAYAAPSNLTRVRVLYNGSSPIGASRVFTIQGSYEIA